MIGVGFLAFILFTPNPFLRVDPPPLDGNDLHPLLQDPGLAFHPPFLYLGYVGFSMAFSFAIAALTEGRAHASWAPWAWPGRPPPGARCRWADRTSVGWGQGGAGSENHR